MTSNSTDPASGTLTEIQATYLYNYCAYGLLALVIFEHLLLLPREIEIVWRRKFSAATWLLLLNRYALIAFIVLQTTVSSSKTGCIIRERLFDAVALVQIIIFAAFSTLRVYAVCDHNKLLAFTIFFLSMVPFGGNVQDAVLVVVSAYKDPLFGFQCSEIWVSESVSENFKIELAVRLCVILADTLTVVSLWTKAGSLRGRTGTHLSDILLRDGTVYFIGLVILNISLIVTANIPLTSNDAPMGLIVQVLTSVLITRFLLNLRQAGQQEEHAATSRLPVSTDIGSFAVQSTIVGNMGETLDHGFEDETYNLDGTDTP